MKQKQNVVESNKIENCAMTKDQMIELMEKINDYYLSINRGKLLLLRIL